MQSVSGVGRIAAIGAVVIAILLVGYILLGSSAYVVTAEFENAGQLVKGNPVQVGGIPIGKVTDLEIRSNGHVDVEMTMKGPQTPLKTGTRAQIRQLSL
jgi:phospholipid/cholesterol/gamma-HCH transport system substrate-binding protein